MSALHAKRYNVATRDMVLCSLVTSVVTLDQTLPKVRTLGKLIVMMPMNQNERLIQQNSAITSTIQAPVEYMDRAERAMNHLRKTTNKIVKRGHFFEGFTKNGYDLSNLYLSKLTISKLDPVSMTVKPFRSDKVLLRILSRASLPELILDPSVIGHLILRRGNILSESRI